MALALGVHTTASGNGVTTLTTTGVTTTAGSTLIAVTTMGGSSGGANTYSSLTDSKSGTWTEIGTAAIFSGSSGIRMFYCKGNSGSRGSSHTITFNYNATEFPVIFFLEITGADSSNPLDQNAQQNTDNATPYVVGPTGTTDTADEFVVTAIATDSASSYTLTGYTIDDSNTNSATFWAGAIGHKIVSATGTQTASWTTGPGTSKTAAKIATIRISSGAVSVGLTGEASTSSAGTLAPALALAIAGAAATFGQGSVSTGDVSVALSGLSATTAQGTPATASSQPIAGSAATATAGTLIGGYSRALSGVSATTAQSGFAAGGELGAYTLLGVYDGDGSSPAVTSPITTHTSGSSFVVFYSGYTSNNQTPTDSKGNTYTLIDTAVYLGYSGQFNLKLYGADNGIGGSSHTVSVVKNGQATGEIVVFLGEAAGASSLTDWEYSYGASGTSMTSASITVNGPATLIAIWSGDSPSTSNTIAVDGAWTLIEDFTAWPVGKTSVQTGVASREVTAGTYDATWTCSPSQGAILYILAFEHDGAGNPPATVVTPSGQAATASAGTAAPSSTRPLLGASATGEQGALSAPGQGSLSGTPATASAGTVSHAAEVALSGAQAAAEAGSVIIGQDVTAALTGASAAATAGTLQGSTGGSPHLVSLTILSVGPRLNGLTITDLD